MSICASGNLFAKISFTLHTRLNTLPWLRSNVVRCFSQNSDVSGLPVRYTPKKRRDVSQTQLSPPVDIYPNDGVSTRSSSSANQRKNIHEDRIEAKLLNTPFGTKHEVKDEDENGKEDSDNNEYPKVLPEVVHCVKAVEEDAQKPIFCKGSDPSLGGRFNQEMSYDVLVDEEYMEAPEEVAEEEQLYNGSGRGKSDRTKQGAEKLAVELLAKRAFTAVELRKKLIAKHFSANIVEAVVHDFQHRGLINDGLYAETFSHSRWKSSSWGPRRIKQALAKKGVSEVHMEKAVKLVFEDPKEGDQRSSIRLSSSSLHQLYTQASKQWQRSHNVPHETRKARVIRWLQYRGFDWGIVGIIMKKLESESPP